MKFLNLVIILCVLYTSESFAKLKVISTTTNLQSIASFIGGDRVDVESFSKGTQDPHYIEAKPSYTLKASKADLILSIGLDLEIGWLPLILRGARNPNLLPGRKGSFVAGDYIDTLEKPSGQLSRADGDVHPEGNPHFLLDPVNALIIAEKLSEKFKELDPDNSLVYKENFLLFSRELKEKVLLWKKRITPGIKVITYHKTLTYFYHRFGIENIGYLEPKPGVPPSAGHILDIIKLAKSEKAKTIIVENYFDPSVAKRVAKEIPEIHIGIVPVSVNGDKKIQNIFDLYERLIQTIEGEE